MMPWDCKSPSDVAIYLLANLKEVSTCHRVLYNDETWFLCMAYHEDIHHFNMYRVDGGTRFAFHVGRPWINFESPNMGVHTSIGELIDAVVDVMWKRWEKKIAM